MKVRKMVIFSATWEQVLKDSMSLAGCQIIPIDRDFPLQKCLEIFDKESADKIQSENYKGGKLRLQTRASH